MFENLIKDQTLLFLSGRLFAAIMAHFLINFPMQLNKKIGNVLFKIF